MKKFTSYLIAIFAFILTSSPAFALQKNLPKQPNILIGEQLTLEEKTYTQDTIIISGQNNIDSLIKGDAVIVSGQTNLSSNTNVSEDLIVVSGQQTISGQINQDVIIVAGETKIEEDATINGYLLAIGGQVTLAGKVKGSTHIFAGQAIIKDTAVINGDLEIKAGDITVSEDAQILGEKEVEIYQNWQNWSELKQNNLTQKAQVLTRALRQVFSFYSFLTHLLVLFLLIYFFGKKTNSLIKQNLKSLGRTIGQGLIYFLLAPLTAFILVFTIITVPLSVLIFFTYGFSIYLSSIFTAIAIGQYLEKQKLFSSKNPYLYGFLGLIVLNLFFFVPLLEPLSKTLSLLFGLGVFYTFLKQVFERSK